MKNPAAFDSRAIPAGFRLYGLRSGISKRAGKKDLALFYSEKPARAAAVFTKNLVKAAPVLISKKHVKAARGVRAILINSGCANACTGARGLRDASESLKILSRGLGVPPAQTLVASTGVIGVFLPMDKMKRGVNGLVSLVKKGKTSSLSDAVAAIMTTDTRPKAAAASFVYGGRIFRVWGCVKGAGMIHPNMATMLGVILTDAGLPARVLSSSLRRAADRSFNRLSVDGDTSTNDSVFLLSNNAAGEFPRPDAPLRKLFSSALHEVCLSLSQQVAEDGEGATRTAWVFVQGARRESDAKKIAETIATSPLVKTALHGADPNWGRVMAAAGRAGVDFDPAKASVHFGGVRVFDKGMRAPFSEKALHKYLKGKKITITVDLRQGKAWSHYVTCDYSKDYISINADYTT